MLMVELTRTIRFCLTGRGELLEGHPASNTFAGWPGMAGLGRYYELKLTCEGQPDPQTGYFINIKQMDQAVRSHALPLIAQAIRQDAQLGSMVALGKLMQQILAVLQPTLPGRVVNVCLQLTPFLSLTIEGNSMETVILAHRYEFAAAHRLHVPQLSEEKNRDIFGKCNNPAGHGHNYELEVSVRLPISSDGSLSAIDQLDQMVDEQVIERLDHKHLNMDVPEFESLNPSVEHIAKVIHGWMTSALQESNALSKAELEAVTVWETGKTSCTYRG